MKKKLKIINKRLKFFYIGFFGAAMAVVMMYASNEVAKMFGKENQWDSMAFVGALFGGALTLIGVQMTLNRQYALEYRKEAASRKMYSNDIYEHIGKHNMFMETLLPRSTVYMEIVTFSNDLLDHKDTVLSASVGVGREMYTLCNRYVHGTEFLRDIIEKKLFPEEMRDEYIKNHLSFLSSTFKQIQSELQNEEMEYDQLLGRR